MVRRTFDEIKVKDQLGKPDDLGLFGPFRFKEVFVSREGPTVAYTRDTSGDTIWGKFNWGAANWNGSYSNGLVEQEVTNPNDTFRWRFRFEKEDSRVNSVVTIRWSPTDPSNTTANEDTTTNYRVDFTDGEVWQSSPIFLTQLSGVTVTSIILNTTQTGTLAWEASADGGNNWESITVGVNHTFTNTGKDVRLRATSTGVSTLSEITARYIK